MTTKDRAYLKGLAMNIDPVLSLGKASLTPEFVSAAGEALAARELIKINVLKNCADDIGELARTLAERSRSEVVQVIGRKIVLYKRNKDDIKIVFPGEKLPEKKQENKTEKKAEKKTDKKPADRKNDKKPANRKTDKKTFDSKSDMKSSVRKSDVRSNGFKKSYDKKTGTGRYDKRK